MVPSTSYGPTCDMSAEMHFQTAVRSESNPVKRGSLELHGNVLVAHEILELEALDLAGTPLSTARCHLSVPKGFGITRS